MVYLGGCVGTVGGGPPNPGDDDPAGEPGPGDPDDPDDPGDPEDPGDPVDPAGCVDSATTFCEDFEALAPGRPVSDRWTADDNGAVTIDDVHARGERALHISRVGNGRGRIILPISPVNNSLFGRMYVYVEAFPVEPNFAHFTLVELTGAGSNTKVRPIGGQFVSGPPFVGQGGSFWGPGSDGGQSGDWTNWQESVRGAPGAFHCLEFELDNTDARMTFSVDGVLQNDSTTTATDHPNGGVFAFPQINQITIGWELYQADPTPQIPDPYDVWIDDIALSSTRIGC
jgi:hypothetical protein